MNPDMYNKIDLTNEKIDIPKKMIIKADLNIKE